VLPTVDPHNQYLFFLAEQGIFGLIAFFGVHWRGAAGSRVTARAHVSLQWLYCSPGARRRCSVRISRPFPRAIC